jgi:hypothetical protein
MNIKRLNLDGWMKSKRGFEDTIKYSSAHYTEIEPIIGKDGIYLKGKECWFEVNGVAYTSSKSSFDYMFDILTVRELSKRQTDALEAIVKARLATKSQKKLYGFHVLHGNKFDVNEARRKKRLKDMKTRMQDKRKSATLTATTIA